MGRLTGFGRSVSATLPLLCTLACSEDPAEGTRIADLRASVARATDSTAAVGVPLVDALAHAAGGPDGTSYTATVVPNPGVVVGEITGGSPMDTSIVPTTDLEVCRPFSQSLVPSRNGGVGNAVVWLSGVSSGPKDDAPRRARLTLDGCRFEPRVQRVALTSTLLVNGRDAMLSRLAFTVDGEVAPRATVLLSDAGQIVPTEAVGARAGLVRVEDERHRWVRAYVAVAPHPFVAITAADGQFRFDGIPPGRYTLHIWHERLGTREKTVRVDGGVQARVSVAY